MAATEPAKNGTSTEESSFVLNDKGREILYRQFNGLMADSKQKKISLISFASRWDLLVITVSSLMAIAAGAGNPLLTVRSTARSADEFDDDAF